MNKLLTFLPVLFLPLLGFGQGFDGTSITGTNINLSGASWYIAYGSDSPEGAWYISDVALTNTTATITLPTTLAAGVWRFQFKMQDYDQFPTATVTLADGSNSAAVSTRDLSHWFQSGINITNTYSTNKVTLYLEYVAPYFAKTRLRAMYYTTNLNEDVDYPYGKDFVYDYTYPGTTSTNVDHTINLLPTSSFEAGLGDWRPYVINRTLASTNYVVHGDAQFGTAAVLIPTTLDTLVSPYFYVKPDHRKYNFSLYYKGTGGTVVLQAAVQTPTNYTSRIDTTYTISNSGGAWVRTNWSVALLDYPVNTPYQIWLRGNGMKYDGIQIVEGTNAVAFNTMGNLELGWSNAVPSGIYYTNATTKPFIVARNSSGGTRDVTVYYEWVNHWNETVASGNFTTSLDDAEKVVQEINLPTNPGWFRGAAWSDGVAPMEIVVLHMAQPSASTEDFVGLHNLPTTWQIQGAERAGINWHRALSPDGTTRWLLAEPTDGNFVFNNDLYRLASITNDTITVALLGAANASGVPTYAGTYSATDMSDWTNHVDVMVGNYWVTNSLIQYWEIFNEPSQGKMTVENYTNLLFLGATQVKATSPTAKVVAMGGSATLSFIQTSLNALGTQITNLVDVISIHGYPEGSDPFSSGAPLDQASGWKTNVLDVYGTPNNIPLWNTESGQWDWGGSVVNMRGLVLGGGIYRYGHQRFIVDSMQYVPNQMIQHALAYKAFGFQRYFYYDGRNPTFDQWEDNHTSGWEGNDAIRPKLATLALANHVVEGTTGEGLLPSANSAVVFLYFENGANSRAAVWSTNASHFTITSTNVTPYDWMGAPKTHANYQWIAGRFPTYLYPSNGITSAQFKSHLTNSTIATRTDIYPPQLSIFLFQGSTLYDTNRFYARWSAVDELSQSGPNNQLDLLTRSKISTDGDYDDWSTSIGRHWDDVPESFTLTVQAKDAAGNTTTQTRTFGENTTGTTGTGGVKSFLPGLIP